MPSFYKIEINRMEWEVPEEYQMLAGLGSGACGQVCCADDTKLGIRVAIKKLSRPFQSAVHAKSTYRELRLLKHVNHENVIGLLDVYHPSSSLEDFNSLYLVTHLMGADLHNMDRRPSNIAVNEDCKLKILDLGLAWLTENETTGYVATRLYRAPEIIINRMHYNQTENIWSVGCIIAELLTGRTLFPGTDHIHQLNLIMEILGTPNDDFMQKISSESARNYIQSLPTLKKNDFKDVFKGVNPLAIDLLEKMLELDADWRITAEEALAHPYLSQYADPNNELTSPPTTRALKIWICL